jgi:4-amino-4-deoxy-L-arabinose transferase-like glycosyltransferase
MTRRTVRFSLLALAIALGAAQAWSSRLDIVNDTISYLDMGDYFFHGHPAAIINGIWSPLYAFLLGLTVTLFKPTIYTEYPAIHLLLFLIFLFALACFDYFLRQFEGLRNEFPAAKSGGSGDWAWIAIAYVFFLWASLGLIGVYETNPDMLVAAFFFLACGLLAKIAVGRASWKTFAALGVILGLSYLTKSVMLPISLLFLVATWFVVRQKPRQLLVAAAMFLVVSLPFIGALSAKKGHLTFGDSGKYNYAVHINRIPMHHWQGETRATGAPIHPTRKIVSYPGAFEFNGPLPGTYPAWYDPTFWYEGVQPHFSLRQQVKAFTKNMFGEFTTYVFALNGVLFATLFLAFFEAKDKLSVFETALRFWFLIAIPVISLLLYALVHLESRYVGPFFAVLGASLFASILWADDSPNRRLFTSIAAVQLLMLLWYFAPPAINHIRHPWVEEKGSYEDIAAGARKMGLQPGDQIASVDFSNLGMAMWARLARVQIIAEVYYWPGSHEGTTSFWTAGLASQEELLQQFSRAGARAVVSSDTPTGPEAYRWSRIGNTGYYLLWLNPETLAPVPLTSAKNHS